MPGDPLLVTGTPGAASGSMTPTHNVVWDGTNWRPLIGAWKFLNITSGATTVVKSGSGIMHALIINKGLATATVTLYDNTAASGTKIGTITFGVALLTDPPNPVLYDALFATGLTIVTSGATDITVLYQ